MVSLSCRVSSKGVGKRALVVAVIISSLVCPLTAKPIGKFTYLGQPQDFNSSKFKDTVTVSDSIVAMAEKIYINAPSVQFDSLADTPSIVFILDHSTSMSYEVPRSDRLGNRFSATSAFIDSVAKKFPSAGIGIVVYKQMLFFRAGDSPEFARFPTAADSNGAYLPLHTLNKTYSGKTGAEVLKSFLTTTKKIYPDSNVEYAELTYSPWPWPVEGTNVDVAFEAAKKALTTSSHPKSAQYIIFITDDDVNELDTLPYTKGKNVPSTFTLIFSKKTTVPQNFSLMTANIKINGYSMSNPRSRCWAYSNTTSAALNKFYSDSILEKIATVIKPLQALPKSITVGNSTASTWDKTDSSFTLGTFFPLTGPVTPFKFKITYSVSGVDTVHTVNFFVKAKANFVMPAKEYAIKRWDRDLEFRHNNAPLSAATDQMKKIELAFLWNGGTANYTYTKVKVDLFTTKAPVDKDTLSLTSGTGFFFKGSIPLASNVVKTKWNGTLEHVLAGDSIVAVFRNSEKPQLSLDTLRIVIPVNAVTSALPVSRPAVDGFTVSGAVMRYTLAKQSPMSFKLFDIKGRLIEKAAFGMQPAGSYSVSFSNGRLSAGEYLVDFQAGEKRILKRVTIQE